jgi:hypothetical protein
MVTVSTYDTAGLRRRGHPAARRLIFLPDRRLNASRRAISALYLRDWPSGLVAQATAS